MSMRKTSIEQQNSGNSFEHKSEPGKLYGSLCSQTTQKNGNFCLWHWIYGFVLLDFLLFFFVLFLPHFIQNLFVSFSMLEK